MVFVLIWRSVASGVDSGGAAVWWSQEREKERERGRGRGAKGEMCWVEQTPLHRVRELGDPAKTSPRNWGDGDPVNTSPLSWER